MVKTSENAYNVGRGDVVSLKNHAEETAVKIIEIDFANMEKVGYRNKNNTLVLPSEFDDGEDWSEYDGEV